MRSSEAQDQISEAKEYCRQENIDRIIKFSHYYSKYYAPSCILEDIEIETEEDRYEITASFVYEPNLYEIKDEMYKAVAYYALQISSFYPEVKKFELCAQQRATNLTGANPVWLRSSQPPVASLGQSLVTMAVKRRQRASRVAMRLSLEMLQSRGLTW